ncbi:hypothetical protein [Spirosoma fluminis]
MVNENNPQHLFAKNKWLVTDIDKVNSLFYDTVNALPWHKIDQAYTWRHILPPPVIGPSATELELRTYFPKGAQSDEEIIKSNKNLWEGKADEWFSYATLEIRLKKRRAKCVIRKGLPTLNKRHRTDLAVDEVYDIWVKSIRQLTWREFENLSVTDKIIGPEIGKIVKELSDNFTPKAPPDPDYKSFEELFYDPNDINKCLEALRNFRPDKPVLGEGKNWTGGPKDVGILVAWIDRMETMKKAKIRKLTDHPQLVCLLKQFFVGLDKMGKQARIFDNIVKKDQRDRFIALMPE